MYRLPQTRNLSNDLQTSILDKFGYYSCQYNPVLWCHKWCPIALNLVDDDFGVKYEGIQHARHLKAALEIYHEVSVDWKVFFSAEWISIGTTRDEYFTSPFLDTSTRQ